MLKNIYSIVMLLFMQLFIGVNQAMKFVHMLYASNTK
jgi:hypothetical protein